MDAIIGEAVQYGYPGAFLVAMLESSIPFLPVPYLVVVLLLGSTLNPFWVGVFVGLGAAVGKVTSYLLGRTGIGLQVNLPREI